MGREVIVDQTSRQEWEKYLCCFADSSFYQTWSYGAIHWGQDNLSHLLVKENGRMVGGVQVSILKAPILGARIAYITRGPLWRQHGQDSSPENFAGLIAILREEYVEKRGCFLKVVPNEIDDGSGTIGSLMQEQGFHWQSSVPPYKTFIIDLTPPCEELRKNLHKRWREKLNRAQRNELQILEGTDDDLYEKFTVLYKEMRARKYFVGLDINEFRAVQNGLPGSFKMNILVCTHHGHPVASQICAAIGDTGITILGATGNKGLKSHASYLLRWRVLEWLKEKGCRFFDQGGIDLRLNPGGYHFKAGMGGVEVCSVGHFYACNNVISSFSIRLAEQLRGHWRSKAPIFSSIRRFLFNSKVVP